jgi:hypothetical protein
MDVVSTVLAYLVPVLSALFVWYFEHKHEQSEKGREETRKKAEEENIKRIEARKQENMLMLRMVGRNRTIVVRECRGDSEGKVNGVMEDALCNYVAVSRELKEFLQKSATDSLHGE